MLQVTVKLAKTSFFDSAKVLAATTRAERKVLSKFGSFVRRTARSSIRKRRAISLPGEPPSGHLGLVRQFLFFVYDPGPNSVIIGPALLNRKASRGEALQLLEYGGETQRRTRGQVRMLHYRARPFMQPAFDREAPKLPGMWKDSIKP